MFVLSFLIITFLFNKINLIISFIHTSHKVTYTLSDAKFLPFFGIIFVILIFIIMIFTIIFTFSIG